MSAHALALTVLAAATVHAAETPADGRARQLAAILGVQPLIEKLLLQESDTGLQAELDRLRLHQQALEEIERASLMIDSTLALLQREEFASTSARQALDSRYQSAVTRWSIAALLVGSGTTITGTALQLGNSTEAKIGDGLIIGGAALSAAFSVVALVKKNRGRTRYPIETNCLAPLFDRAATARSELPPPVWRYLATSLIGERASFRAQILARFGQQGRAEIELLTRPLSSSEAVPAELLALRANMLDDLRTRVAAMKDDLQLLIDRVRPRTVSRR